MIIREMKKILAIIIAIFATLSCFGQQVFDYRFKRFNLYAPEGYFNGDYHKEHCYDAYVVYWGKGDDRQGFFFWDEINGIEYKLIEYHREDSVQNEYATGVTDIFLFDDDNPEIKGRLHISRSSKSKYSGAVQISLMINGFQYIFSDPCGTYYTFY